MPARNRLSERDNPATGIRGGLVVRQDALDGVSGSAEFSGDRPLGHAGGGQAGDALPILAAEGPSAAGLRVVAGRIVRACWSTSATGVSGVCGGQTCGRRKTLLLKVSPAELAFLALSRAGLLAPRTSSVLLSNVTE